MGKRGPAKKPTALKKAQGQRAREMPKHEVFPPAEENPVPKFELSQSGEAIFSEISKKLLALGLLTELDVVTFSRYCDLFSKLLIYKEAVEKNPMVEIVTQNGLDSYPNPALKAYIAISEKLLKIEQQFGMTPAARAAIGSVALSPGETEKEKVKKKLYG